MLRTSLGAVVAAAMVMGCAATPGPPPQREPAADPDADLFAPIVAPGGVDPAKARLGLSGIPGDPEAPQPGGRVLEALPERAVRHFEEARRLFREHRYTETILEIEKALRYAPDHPEANRLLALACLLSGSDGRAIQSANRALVTWPDDLASHYTLGRLADKGGDVGTALREYRIALKCPTDDDDKPYRILTDYYLGVLLEKNGYYMAAVDRLTAFEDAIRALDGERIADPELATIARVHRGSAASLVAGAYAKLGDYGAAADALAIAIQQYPDDFKIRGEYVRMLVRANRLDAASREADRFVEDSKGDRDAVRLVLAVHRRAGHPDRGIDAVRKVARQHPENAELWLLHVDALLASDRLDEASRVLDELLERHPKTAEAHWKRIALERSRQQWSAWLSALAEELAVDPESYARATDEIERLPVDVLRRFADEATGPDATLGGFIPQPESEDASAAQVYLLGRMCDRLDRLDDARMLFERSLEQREGFLPASLGVAEMYVRRCRWDDALDVIHQAVEAGARTLPAFERLMGQCYDGLDQIDKAVSHYENAIKLDNSDADAMMLLGRLYERVNNYSKARKHYQAAIALTPEDAGRREALVRNLIADAANLEGRTDEQTAEWLRRIHLEVQDLQRIAPDHPATIRCVALMRLRGAETGTVGPDDYAVVLKKLIDKDPDDLRSRIDLAATYSMTMLDHGSALAQAEATLARDPCSAEGNEIAAQSLKKLLHFDEAERRLEQMLKWYPNRQSWLELLAEVHLIIQDYDGAIEVYHRLRALPGLEKQPLAYSQGLLQTLIQARRYDDAYRLVEGWMTDTTAGDPDNQRTRSLVLILREMLLSIDEARKDHDRRIERCREWLKEDAQNTTVRNHLLNALVDANRGDEALALVVSWLADDPDKEWAIQSVSQKLLDLGRNDEAIELSRSGLASADEPDERLRQLRILVEVYREAGRPEMEAAAIRDVLSFDLGQFSGAFQRLLENNLLPGYRTLLGSTLARAGKFDEAIAHVNALIGDAESDEDRAPLLQLLAGVHQRQRRMDLAEQRLREAHKLTPLEPGINNDLGYTLADRGKDVAEAERMIRLAVGEHPRVAAYLDSLGWVLYKMGDMEGAALWLGRASTLERGQDPVIFDHLGDAYWRLGRKDDAHKAWTRCIELIDEPEVQGWEPPEEEFRDVVRDKLETADSGLEPKAAPLAKESP